MTKPFPSCPSCGNNRQVWVNQITNRLTCHRAFCHKEIDMVWRKLDPAADWDAWCDDHPEPPERCEVDEKYWQLECTECGSIPWDEAEIIAEFESLPTIYKCNECGVAAYDEGHYNLDALLEDIKNDYRDV